MRVSTLYGIDGAKSGWVVAQAAPDLSQTSITIESDLATVFERVMTEDGLLIIDVPIGLPESGQRKCDFAARALLRPPRASSVFPAPIRAAFGAETYQEASKRNFEASGKRLSQQSFALLPKIQAVDRLMTAERQARIREGHPEVSFMLLGDRAIGLPTNKKRSAGKRERMCILQRQVSHIEIKALLAGVPRRAASTDDFLDALACLLTAWRVCNDNELVLPGDCVQRDARGLRMEIVA
jgi:predicted RNase H-like nuclease